jgi:hypothetical protein
MVDGELFGYLVLVTDTERNIKWVRRFWGTRVVLRTGVIYATSLRSGLVTHVAWLYLESPKPHGEIIQQSIQGAPQHRPPKGRPRTS